MSIEVLYDEQLDLFTIRVNGHEMFECMAADELNCLTLGEIEEVYRREIRA